MFDTQDSPPSALQAENPANIQAKSAVPFLRRLFKNADLLEHQDIEGRDFKIQINLVRSTVSTGSNYRAATQSALDSISSGQGVGLRSCICLYWLPAQYPSATARSLKAAALLTLKTAPIAAPSSLDTQNVQIPYFMMTGNPYFGLRRYGTQGLNIRLITMNLSGEMGIQFDCDQAANSDVKMDVITITRAGSHAVETWNINGLTINQVIARNVGEYDGMRIPILIKFPQR
ncbi:hypothetical protein FQN51_004071 [Onygenales sp. PD_10]|nr:hypothetical protein FQN51_004071 [Onygenales sp. PD_10]